MKFGALQMKRATRATLRQTQPHDVADIRDMKRWFQKKRVAQLPVWPPKNGTNTFGAAAWWRIHYHKLRRKVLCSLYFKKLPTVRNYKKIKLAYVVTKN